MKNKFIILLLILSLFLIGGCNQAKGNEIKINYQEEDLANISLYICDLDITLDLSNDTELKDLLLSLKIYEDNSQITTDETPSFILSFNNYQFIVYSLQLVYYIEDGKEVKANTSNNEFDYLRTLFNFDRLDFSNYNNAETIKVFNSNNDSVKITDKEEFLNNLNEIEYIKLNKKEIFELGDLKYKIMIDEETISIYTDYIVKNDNLYKLSSGDFSFLNSLKFSSSSGWLPWI